MASEVPVGRTTALFAFLSTSVASVVLALVHFLSSESEGRISFAVDYIWETVILVLSFVAMVMVFCVRLDDYHMSPVDDSSIDTTRWTTSRIVRYIALTVCGLASSLLPFIEAAQTVSCLIDAKNVFLYIFKLVSFLAIALFSFAQTTFLFICRRYRCQSKMARLYLSVILTANVVVCINCFLDIIRASNSIAHIDYKEISDNRTRQHFFERTLVFSVCKNATEQTDNITLQIYNYCHPFSLEYALLSFGLLFPMWNIRIRTRVSLNEEDSDDLDTNHDIHVSTNDNETTERETTNVARRSRALTILRTSVMFVSKYALPVSALFALSVFCTHVYVEIKTPSRDDNATDWNENSYKEVNYYLQTFYTYIICIVPFIGYMISRKNNMSKWSFNTDNLLLLFSAIGMIILVVFETTDAMSVLVNPRRSHVTEEALYFLKILFHYLGTYCQMMFILKAFGISTSTSIDQDRRCYIKGIVTFLCVTNAERWCVDTFLPATPLRYANDISGDDTFGATNWWLITELLFPIVVFYRLISALLCYEIRHKFNQTT